MQRMVPTSRKVRGGRSVRIVRVRVVGWAVAERTVVVAKMRTVTGWEEASAAPTVGGY